MQVEKYNQKGYKWFNNNKVQTRAKVCPEGYVPGRLSTNTAGLDKDAVLEYYKDHTYVETAKYFNTTTTKIQRLIKDDKPKKSKAFHAKWCTSRSITEAALEKKKKTMQKRYGVDYVSQIECSKEKRKEALAKKGYTSGAQSRIPAKAFEIISDRNKLENFILSLDRRERSRLSCAEILGMKRTTFGAYVRKHELTHLLYKRGGREVEEQLAAILEGWGFTCLRNKRTIIRPYELDIYIPEIKVAIEYNGTYWHSFKDKKKNDDLKMKLCAEKGILLLHIEEEQYKTNKDGVVLALFSALGLDKIGQLVMGTEVKNSEQEQSFYDLEVESDNHNFLTEIGIVHNSEQFGQDLRHKGINARRQSIDKVTNGVNLQYAVLKNAFYDRRLKIFNDQDMLDELVQLEQLEDGTVDKSAAAGSTDDSAQALCGAVYAASLCKSEYLRSNAILLEHTTGSKEDEALPDDLVASLISQQFSEGLSISRLKPTQGSDLREDFDQYVLKNKHKEKEKTRGARFNFF